jgi:hypothetical protein
MGLEIKQGSSRPMTSTGLTGSFLIAFSAGTGFFSDSVSALVAASAASRVDLRVKKRVQDLGFRV